MHLPQQWTRIAPAVSQGWESWPTIPTSDSLQNPTSLNTILSHSRKPTTNQLYSYKWLAFQKFAQRNNPPPAPTTLRAVLLFLSYLFDCHLSLSTIKVYMSAIVAHQLQYSDATLLFQHPTLKQFLWGVAHFNPPRPSPTPQWSLHTVLRHLLLPPFEPLATSSECLLSFKVLFLVAITSAGRASELTALHVNLPFL